MSQSATSFSVQLLPKTFGAIIGNIRLNALDEDQFNQLYQVWIDHGLLIIPDQHLSDDDQRLFAERFGELVAGLEAIEISNLKPDGSLRDAPDDDMMKVIRGDTAFADMRAAWDALEGDLAKRVSTLSAFHSLAHSQRKLGEATKDSGSEYIGYGLDVQEIPLRPLLKIHPETGRKSLSIGRHAYGIPGLSPQESAELLDDLIEFAVSDDQRVYQHQWSKGDVVVWDNRSLMHKACDWNFREPRVMLHSRIAGDPKTECAINSAG